jgi:polysaccharide pyruvyl transferase WcaK-like protein
VSVGAGPIYNPLSRLLMKGAARRAHYRSYRDVLSQEFMARIGMRRPLDPLFPDLAFALPAPPPRERDAEAPLTVAVGLMSYFGWSASRAKGQAFYTSYIAGITDYVVWLLQTGRRVRLVTGDDIDVEAAQTVRESVLNRAPDLARMLDPFETPRDLHDVMRQMSGADIVVATRFHNIVCALAIGKATISLGYAEKNRALLCEVGLGEFCQSVEGFDLELLKSQTERIVAERALHEAVVARRVAFFRDRLNLQERILAEEFLEP